MQKFVFWTGVYNILFGAAVLTPGVPDFLGIKIPESNFWLWIPGVLVIYLGGLLILCSRDLNGRGAIVYWEGILRLIAFLLLAYFGFLAGHGFMLGIFGVIDLLIGVGYLVGLPRALSTSPSNLLMDRGP